MTRETIKEFNNRSNVTKITSDNGNVSYLTQSVGFADETFKAGATALNTVETERKHVLFLFNSADAEVGRYYMCKEIQGMTPQQLVEKKHCLVFFNSWNPNANEGAGSWVPCVSLSSQEALSKSAVHF